LNYRAGVKLRRQVLFSLHPIGGSDREGDDSYGRTYVPGPYLPSLGGDRQPDQKDSFSLKIYLAIVAIGGSAK